MIDKRLEDGGDSKEDWGKYVLWIVVVGEEEWVGLVGVERVGLCDWGECVGGVVFVVCVNECGFGFF